MRLRYQRLSESATTLGAKNTTAVTAVYSVPRIAFCNECDHAMDKQRRRNPVAERQEAMRTFPEARDATLQLLSLIIFGISPQRSSL